MANNWELKLANALIRRESKQMPTVLQENIGHLNTKEALSFYGYWGL